MAANKLPLVLGYSRPDYTRFRGHRQVHFTYTDDDVERRECACGEIVNDWGAFIGHVNQMRAQAEIDDAVAAFALS